MTNWILDIIFPKKCIGCGKFDSYFCKECVANIMQGELICPRCSRSALGGETHPFCQNRFGLDGLWSLGIYQGFLKTAIKKLKYEPRLVRDFAPVLVNIMVEYFAKYRPLFLDLIKKDKGRGWVVMPVPLHWWRENKRGFNQSNLIGQELSKRLGLAYQDGLKRIRYTKSQVGLKGNQRKENIRGAFALSSDCNLSPVTCCLLIDDVWTTGSTLKECCYVLKSAGAQKVWAITIAR